MFYHCSLVSSALKATGGKYWCCVCIYICLLWSFEHSGPMTLCTCVDVSVLHRMHLVRALSCGYIQGHHVSTHIQSCTDETCMYADGIYMYTIVDIVITVGRVLNGRPEHII